MSVTLGLALITGVAAGCGEDDKSSAGSSQAATTSSDDSVKSDDTQEGTGGLTSSPASDLRVDLVRLLGEHALLASFATQKGASGDKDFEAAAGVLDQNTDDLGAAIGSLYGDDAQGAFEEQWRNHIGFFVDYTKGKVGKDDAAVKKAVTDLDGYKIAISALLGGAIEVDPKALQPAFQTHIGQLAGSVDAYVAKDYAGSFAKTREAYAHMFMTGDTLAGAIATQKPDELSNGEATEAAVGLRIALGRNLGEHAMLAIMAKQSGYDGSADFAPLAASLDKNTDDLGAAIGSVYGKEAQTAFEKLWRDHIGFFVDYTAATKKGDDAAKQKALSDLEGYKVGVSDLLGGATGLDPKALEEGIGEHITQLADAVDAYAAGDYDKTYDLTREAYHHMYATGDMLAAAIVKQSPEKFS